MRLDGIHHITAITGNAPVNVDFYARVLGLRMVKKTVNQDDPTVYHLFYADEQGSPGSDITFFEYPGARRGRPGAGMVHTVGFRVASTEALDFWERRLAGEEVSTHRDDNALSFEDPEGIQIEVRSVTTPDAPLIAEHPEIPAELALHGFDGARAFASNPEASRNLLEQVLGFIPTGEAAWEVRGPSRGGHWELDPPPADRGVGGAGTVHHIAFATQTEEQEAWQRAVAVAGMQPTPVIDRFWFRSVYFREPNGVLFELATLGPGFAVDEDPEHLGESLILPPAFEHLRARIEPVLTPIENPRASWVT
jgi:glyoxalase family protein